MKVYLAQLKCKSNHCVIAVAGEYESKEEARELACKLGQESASRLKSGWDAKCDVCHAGELYVELEATRFTTLAEAMAAWNREEAMQGLMDLWLRASRN